MKSVFWMLTKFYLDEDAYPCYIALSRCPDNEHIFVEEYYLRIDEVVPILKVKQEFLSFQTAIISYMILILLYWIFILND